MILNLNYAIKTFSAITYLNKILQLFHRGNNFTSLKSKVYRPRFFKNSYFTGVFGSLNVYNKNLLLKLQQNHITSKVLKHKFNL